MKGARGLLDPKGKDMATKAKTQDYTAIMKDMMSMFPIDTKAMQDMMKTQSAMAEKMSGVALDAAQKSTDLSSKWALDTLAKMEVMTKAKDEPADYAKSMTEFMQSTAESTAEHMAAFAEIAKKVQTETMELMLAAGKDAAAEITEVAKKATSATAAK